MELELGRVVTISGKPGLYRVVTATRTSFVVEAIDEKKTKTVISATQRLASLQDISIYTVEGQIMLSEVFERMQLKESSLAPTDPKGDNYAIMEYFEQIVPEYDEDKVHTSDMRKVIKWFGILRPHIDFTVKPEESQQENA